MTAASSALVAKIIRQVLVAERVSGALALDQGLREMGRLWGVAELETLATLLGLNREFGIPLLPGIEAMNRDLRERQRASLIAFGRSALTKALLPTAAGILMPFLAILLYPALRTLMAAF